MAWGLLLSKRHNPAKSPRTVYSYLPLTVWERFNVGINCITGRVIFPAHSHETVSQAFEAIAFALED